MKWTSLFVLGVCAVAGCAGAPVQKPPKVAVEAKRVADPPKPVELVEIPQLLPLPGQLKPMPSESASDVPRSHQACENWPMNWPVSNPPARISSMLPKSGRLIPMRSIRCRSTNPAISTDISLEMGEELTSVSAGRPLRWIIGDTTSGAEATRSVHVLVKPARTDIRTNLIINTIDVPIIWNYPQPLQHGSPRSLDLPVRQIDEAAKRECTC